MSRGRRANLTDSVAAGLFGGAVAVSAALLGGPVIAALAGIAAFGGALFALSRVDGTAAYELPEFAVGSFDPVAVEKLPELLLTEMSELLLTDSVATGDNELLLEDPLPAPDRDSRVIRLFDPRNMPTAGDLHERIERHLQPSRAAYPDATAELHSALSALKNSLR